MSKILIAEDDKDIIELMRLYLENDGMEIFSATNGVDALYIMKKEQIDIAVLDIMMPKMDGYELTKKIREFSNIPIIILSAKISDADKILGLNIGADDYISKPFNPLEIVARVKAHLRRCYGMEEKKEKEQYVVDDIVLDTDAMVLNIGSEVIPLTSMEFKILKTLMKHPGRVFTKAQLYERANGDYFDNDDNTMMVHISKIRAKMGDRQYIKTVRGLGYKFEAGDDK